MKQRVRSLCVRGQALSLCLAVLLVACGGSDEPVAAARSGTADIDASGGSVDAVLDGGALVTLTVPPGALGAKTTLHLDPASAPSGTLAALQISPAGLQFRAAATLEVTLPSHGATSTATSLAFDAGGVRIPLGAQIDATRRSARVSLLYLGTGSATPFTTAGANSGSRQKALAAPADPNALQLLLALNTYDDNVLLLQELVTALASDGSRDNAIRVQVAMAGFAADPRASPDPRVHAAVATWRTVVCGQQQFTISALDSFDVASDYRGFLSRAGDVLVFGQLAQQLGDVTALLSTPAEPGCSNLPSDFAQPVRDRFPPFLASARQDLGLLDPQIDFFTILQVRLPELFSFAAGLQFLGVDDLAGLVSTLIGEQTVRLRGGAYAACTTRLVTQTLQQVLLQREVGDGSFEGSAPYSSSDLIQDVQYCGMPIHWSVQDAAGNVLSHGDAGGLGPGSVVSSVQLSLSGAAKLVLSGPLSALRCPSGIQNNEQLVFSAGPANATTSMVGQLTPSNDSGYLEVSNLELTMAQLQAATQLNGTTGNGKLVVVRQGGVCNSEFPLLTGHSALVTFALQFAAGLQISTSSLPTVSVNSAYSVLVSSTGGTAPFVWTAAGLPAGLNLNTGTGLIAGSATSPGAFDVALEVTSADGSSAQATLALNVVPNVAGTYVGTETDEVSGGVTPVTRFVFQLANRVAIGSAPTTGGVIFFDLYELGTNGTLTFLGLADGNFVIDLPATAANSYTCTGQALGETITYRCFNTTGPPEPNSYNLTKQ